MSQWQDQNPYAPPLAEEMERTDIAAARAQDLLQAAAHEASKALPWTAIVFSLLVLAITALLGIGLLAISQTGWPGFIPLGIAAFPGMFAASLWRLRQSILRLQVRKDRHTLSQVVRQAALLFAGITFMAAMVLVLLSLAFLIDYCRVMG